MNKELFMITSMAWSLYFVLKHAEDGNRKAFFVAGLLLGTATLCKQVAGPGIVVAVVSGVYAVRDRERGLRQALPFFLSFLVGALLPWIAFVFYFLYLGAIKDFLFWVFVYPYHYMNFTFGKLTWELAYGRNLWVMSGTVLVWPFSIIGLVSVLKRAPGIKERLACLFYPLSAIGVCAGWNFSPHYFVQMAPVLAIFSGEGVAALVERIRMHGLRPFSALGLALLVVSGALFVHAHHRFFISYSGDEISMREYLWLWNQPPAPILWMTRQLGLGLRQITREMETIFVWKHHPQISFYALRKTPARAPVLSPPGLPFLEDEAVQDIQRGRPEYVVVFDSLFLYNFPRLRELILKDYTKAIGIAGSLHLELGIYTRRVNQGR